MKGLYNACATQDELMVEVDQPKELAQLVLRCGPWELGTGNWQMESTFSSRGQMPCWSTLCPRKYKKGTLRMHLR